MTKKILFIILLRFLILLSPPRAYAVDCSGEPPKEAGQLRQYIDSCQNKINSLRQEQQTLKAALNLITSKINLTQAQIQNTTTQIAQLETEINSLSTVITDLNGQLDKLVQVFVTRVKESYKTRDTNPLLIFFSSGSYSTFQTRLKYLNNAQRRDQIIIKELESARLDFDKQKATKEQKQTEILGLKTELETQKKVLGVQSSQKNRLLAETKNNEKTYQELLSKAVAELAAIESIIAGKGTETEVGDISVNQKIATIIPSSSACSTGAHLHFEVIDNKTHQNPANFLKSVSVIWDNSPDPSFGFGGSWDWPISEPIRITQGYGHTAYSSRYANDQHTGIDMTNANQNYEVKAVRPGKLFRGSIACGGGTLKYVRVKHSSDQYDTYYLHVNYF